MEKHPTKESLTVEFKSDKKCISMDVLYEELVGMANSEGGSVYLGVEDDGTPHWSERTTQERTKNTCTNSRQHNTCLISKSKHGQLERSRCP